MGVIIYSLPVAEFVLKNVVLHETRNP